MRAHREHSWVAVGAFALALSLALITQSSGIPLLPLREATKCTDVTIDKGWTGTFTNTKRALGTLTVVRVGDKLTDTFANLRKPVDKTLIVDEQCETKSGKKICVEVFCGDAPVDAVHGEVNFLKADAGGHKAGSTYCAHYKNIVLTKCPKGKAESFVKADRRTFRTIKGVEKEIEKNVDKKFRAEASLTTTVDGMSFLYADVPGFVTRPGHTTPMPERFVVENVHLTFFECDGEPVCVVKWTVKNSEVSGPAVADLVCTVTVPSKPVIHCVDSDGYKEALKERAKAKGKTPQSGTNKQK